jgi:hypothetical protein
MYETKYIIYQLSTLKTLKLKITLNIKSYEKINSNTHTHHAKLTGL